MEQRTLEWHEMRSKNIGSSDATTIMNESFGKTVRDLWLEKLGIKGTFKGNFHTERGVRLEDSALKFAEKELGLQFIPVVKKHENISYMIASLDGFNEANNIILEIKCPEKKLHDTIPTYYHAQLMHQWEVVKPSRMYYLSYLEIDGVQKGKIIEVFPDKKYINKLLEAEADFWHCVTNVIEPKNKFDDYEKRTDIEYTEKLMIYLANRDKAKFWSDLEVKSKEELIKMTTIPTLSMGCKISEMTRAGSVDMKRLIAEYSITNIEDFRQESTKYWKIDKYKEE